MQSQRPFVATPSEFHLLPDPEGARTPVKKSEAKWNSVCGEVFSG